MPMLYRPPQVSPDLSNGTTSQFDSQRMTNSGQRSHDACVPQAQSQSQSSNSVSAEHHSQSDTNGPSSQSHLHRHSSARDEAYERDAQITFEKTVGGHYRHGKTGYKQVGVLFLTWAADDLQCKKTEVDALNDLFANDFKFETDYYEIPSERWQTGLMRKVSDFMWKYDSPDCLTIIYYGGHGYEGKETMEFKLAAKVEADGDGDPTVFFNDIRNAARLPACDQLMIIDCCYAAKAFGREHIGKRKFELLTSAAHDAKSDAPSLPGSFTRTLIQVLPSLLKDNPNGFSTSHLFRVLYHTVPKTKPLLFDQSRHSYGSIWLRPQVVIPKPPLQERGRYLTITLRLNTEPRGAAMNELASHLQYLPHVDEVRFKELYAPRDQIENFMVFVLQTQKLRPLMRRLHARRQIHKALDDLQNNEGAAPSPSMMGLHLGYKHQSVYDWSSAKRPRVSENPEDLRHKRQKSSTWPPTQPDESA